MKIYEALYNPMTEESADCTISIHKTKAGAEKAIEDHKAKEKKEFDDGFYNKMTDEEKAMYNFKWDDFKSWRIVETELLD